MSLKSVMERLKMAGVYEDGIKVREPDAGLILARIAELEAKLDPPPDGYASWEDWLAVGHRITFDYSWSRSKWTWFQDLNGSGQFFPTYPAALEAAKKEAGGVK